MPRHNQQIDSEQEEIVISSAGSEEVSDDESGHEKRPSGLTKLSTAHQGSRKNHLATSLTHREEVEISQLSRKRRKSKSEQQLREIRKNQQHRQSKFASPPPDAIDGRAVGKRKNQRAKASHPDARRLGHYENEMKDVIDAARTLLTVYLFVENAFPGDDVPPASGMEDSSQGTVKWRKVLDHFFYEAVGANEDASRADPPLKSNDQIRMAINNKQSSLRNGAFEAARSAVEQQFKIEDSNGWKASIEEIQAIVARELDGEPLGWTIGTTYSNRESFYGIFLHASIPIIISKICFTKSGLCVGVSPDFSSLFDPTPLPLIAFAATLSNAVLSSWRTGIWNGTQFSASRYRKVYNNCIQALQHMSRANQPVYDLLTRGTYHFCMEQARIAGKLGVEEAPAIKVTELRMPQFPRFELEEEDYQNPWHRSALETAPGTQPPTHPPILSPPPGLRHASVHPLSPHEPHVSLDNVPRDHPPQPQSLSPPPGPHHSSAPPLSPPHPMDHPPGMTPGYTPAHPHSPSYMPFGSQGYDGMQDATAYPQSSPYNEGLQELGNVTSPIAFAHHRPLSPGLPGSHGTSTRAWTPSGALHAQASKTTDMDAHPITSTRVAAKRKRVNSGHGGGEGGANQWLNDPEKAAGSSRQPRKAPQPRMPRSLKTPHRLPPAEPPVTRLRHRAANARIMMEETPTGSGLGPQAVPVSARRAGLRQLQPNRHGRR